MFCFVYIIGRIRMNHLHILFRVTISLSQLIAINEISLTDIDKADRHQNIMLTYITNQPANDVVSRMFFGCYVLIIN